ncbi:MAG: hypothetical protein GY943_36510 [Chloroflexi bacterium]|nr:hypothetical protein [Chloroflexota bacterium]
MSESKLDIAELQRRTPATWTALLQNEPGLEDVVVTAVSAKPIRTRITNHQAGHLGRYVVSLANHNDPISFIAKFTNRQEVNFYRTLAQQLPQLAPKSWFTHVFANDGWVILEDVPNHTHIEKWTPTDVDNVVAHLTLLHQTFWKQKDLLEGSGISHFLHGKQYTWETLRNEQSFFFEEGPATPISEHAIHHAGRLAPALLQAANGLTVIRSLGGWPGILGETHLTAVADLLDDPVPILEPLRNLPNTLLHGDPNTYHWRMTLFNEQRLLDWSKTAYGPGIMDLVSFLEQFELIYTSDHPFQVDLRTNWPITEETIIDSYLLQLSATLTGFDARATRQAISAARCLYVLTNWFPYFASWATEMPDKFTWQKINRLNDEQLASSTFQPMIKFRPYLAGVFQRFLQAYRTL